RGDARGTGGGAPGRRAAGPAGPPPGPRAPRRPGPPRRPPGRARRAMTPASSARPAITGDADALPDVPIAASGPVSTAFRARALSTLRTAARYVRDLPYGRVSDRARPVLVLEERRGTCTTKHALLAILAAEQGVDLALTVGIYEMNEANTPGVGAVLAAHGLATIPEAHCYLTWQ